VHTGLEWSAKKDERNEGERKKKSSEKYLPLHESWSCSSESSDWMTSLCVCLLQKDEIDVSCINVWMYVCMYWS
jgi:hypothetical protein